MKHHFINDIPVGEPADVHHPCTILFLIRQQFHCTVADIDQIDQHLNPFVNPHHVAAKRPECFLLIITGFYIPPERVQEQRDIFHPVTSGMV